MHAAIQCLPLPDIDNGVITYFPDNVPNYDLRTVAIYTCNDNFDFSTPGSINIRVCEDDGKWTGSDPTCARTNERKIN